ncbi:hypothetical protein IKN40_04505 [bacterium]|nr:hypothetical protein [bacterium]
MKKELANEWLRNDFINKTILSERELDVLLLYVKGETIVKIADTTGQGTATVSVIIAQLKQKYEIYKQLELTKLQLLK